MARKAREAQGHHSKQARRLRPHAPLQRRKGPEGAWRQHTLTSSGADQAAQGRAGCHVSAPKANHSRQALQTAVETRACEEACAQGSPAPPGFGSLFAPFQLTCSERLDALLIASQKGQEDGAPHSFARATQDPLSHSRAKESGGTRPRVPLLDTAAHACTGHALSSSSASRGSWTITLRPILCIRSRLDRHRRFSAPLRGRSILFRRNP